MPLVEEGKKAPAFTLKDQEGKTHKLADYAGQPVVLYFYPKDDTPGCTDRDVRLPRQPAEVQEEQGRGAWRQHPRREEQGEDSPPSTT